MNANAFKTKHSEHPNLNGSTSSICSQVSQATTESSVKSSNKKEETTSQINSTVTSESSVKSGNNVNNNLPDNTSIASEVTMERDEEPELENIGPEKKKLLQQEKNLLHQEKPPNGGILFFSNFEEIEKQTTDKDDFTGMWLHENFEKGYKGSSEENEKSSEDALDKEYRKKYEDSKSTAKITEVLQNNNVKSQQQPIQQGSQKRSKNKRKSNNFFTKLFNLFRKRPRTSCNPKTYQQKLSQSPVLVK
jgi:hypothetical protein